MKRTLPEYKLALEPQTEEAKQRQGFKWADPEVGARHRIGGEPAFIQQPDWPSCPTCHQTMSFYGQLDSVGDSVCIADCGLIYVFICFDCNTTSSFVQSS